MHADQTIRGIAGAKLWFSVLLVAAESIPRLRFNSIIALNQMNINNFVLHEWNGKQTGRDLPSASCVPILKHERSFFDMRYVHNKRYLSMAGDVKALVNLY